MDDTISVEDARARIDDAWNDWVATLDSVPVSRWEEPGVCGEWSIKQVVGHIAVWDDLAIQDIARVERGEERTPRDWQKINDETAAAFANRSVEDLRDEMIAKHAELIDALMESRGFDTDSLGGDTWDHYPEHTEQLAAWRDSGSH